MCMFLVKNPKCQQDVVIEWVTRELQKISLKAVICKLGMATSVYHI